MTIIDDYLVKVSEPQKAELQRIRSIIKATIPEVEESFGYGMPVFKYKHKYLLGFAVFKNHLSIFPGATAINQLGNKLEGYKVSKGTIQFSISTSLSEDLIKEIISIRIGEINKK